jgi:hypothetical protein
MERKDYIPRKDEDFNILQGNVYMMSTTNMTEWLIPVEFMDTLGVPRSRWIKAFELSRSPATRTKVVTQEKNDARKGYTAVLRPFIQGMLMHNGRVSDADRCAMGLPVYDRTPTRPLAPASRPELRVDFSQFLRHRIFVRDSVLSGRAKPAHTIGYELWRKIGGEGEPSFDDMQLVELVTRSPHVVEYASADRGKTVWYFVRWVNTRGEKGPRSEIISAIVP